MTTEEIKNRFKVCITETPRTSHPRKSKVLPLSSACYHCSTTRTDTALFPLGNENENTRIQGGGRQGTHRCIFLWPRRILGPRVDVAEPRNRLVHLFPAQLRVHLDQLFRRGRGKQTPPAGQAQSKNVYVYHRSVAYPSNHRPG